MSKRPFLLQTRWVVGHVLIFLLVVLMVNLALWQLRRLDHREDINAEVRAAMNAPVVDASQSNINSLGQYQHVKVVGAWDPANTFLIRYPLNNGQPGYYVVEPIIPSNGGGPVLVNRGWIPLDQGKTMTRPSDADGGSAAIEGTIQDATTSHPEAGSNGANPAVVTQTGIETRWVQLTSPVASGDPIPLDPPDLSNGPHLSYALQWFSFCLIAIIGWAILCWRASRPS